jgi:hypothetical protein
MLLRKYVYEKIGHGLIVWVNPRNIKFYIGKNVPYIDFPNKYFKGLEILNKKTCAILTAYTSFAVSKKYYGKENFLEEHYKYQILKNLIDNKEDYRKSIWYQDLCLKIKVDGIVKHKKIIIKNSHELNDFFENYVLDIVYSMEKHGYMLNKSKQIGYVMIGKEGELHKSNAGDHRFIIARILGVPKIPLYVKGIHEEFLEKKGIPKSMGAIHQIADVIREIEHVNIN